MNAYPSNHTPAPRCPAWVGAHRWPFLVAAFAVCMLGSRTSLADNTRAKGTMTVYAEAACTTPTCSEAQITVTLSGNCAPGPACNVGASVDIQEDCGLFAGGFDSLVLYDNPTGTCLGTGTEAPYPVDLLAGTFQLSVTQWNDLLAGNQLVVAEAGGGGEASAEVQPSKTADAIPTTSEWGLVLMTMVLVTAGTIVISRSLRRARTM